jgi:hypothetical protein
MRHGEVGDADRAHPTLADELLERSPGLDVLVEHRQRPVDQEQVEDVEPQLAHALVEGAEGGVEPLEVVRQLGGDEDVVEVDAGVGDRRTDTLLVLVALRGVDEAVSDVQRGADRRCRLLLRDLEDPEAHLGDLQAVVHGQ